MSDRMKISVVVATYNRLPLLRELLAGLAKQTIASNDFEVIVVDDGSRERVKPELEKDSHPFAVTVLEQANAGPAAARHNGILQARGEIIVVVDDDMLVPADFLAAHRRAHEAGATLVLGHIVEEEQHRSNMPLFERFHSAILQKNFDDLRNKAKPPRGIYVTTGNVSFRRAEYLAVGGFDRSLGHSEDRELGLRLERAGARLAYADDAVTINRSDRAQLEGWMRRNYLYGVYDLRIAKKHAKDTAATDVASPWSYLPQINPISRALVLGTVVAPNVGKRVARAAIRVAMAVDRLGAERAAIAGATLVFGLEYFRGVREESGSLAAALGDLRAYLRASRSAHRHEPDDERNHEPS